MITEIKIFLLSAFLLLPAACTNQPTSSENDDSLNTLQKLKWQRRVILVKTDDKTHKETLELITSAKTDIDERHITWFILKEDHLHSNHPGKLGASLKREISEYLAGHRVILIGKDSGVKLRESGLDINAIFALIDTMPMRINEMRDAE